MSAEQLHLIILALTAAETNQDACGTHGAYTQILSCLNANSNIIYGDYTIIMQRDLLCMCSICFG